MKSNYLLYDNLLSLYKILFHFYKKNPLPLDLFQYLLVMQCNIILNRQYLFISLNNCILLLCYVVTHVLVDQRKPKQDQAYDTRRGSVLKIGLQNIPFYGCPVDTMQYSLGLVNILDVVYCNLYVRAITAIYHV